MILDLVKKDDPILKRKMEEFDFSNPPVDPAELAVNLAETMIANKGLGLAANQVGLPYRVFAMVGNPVLVCFNPRIVDTSSDIVLLEEGCLTFPGVFIKIKRPSMIRARFTMADGKTVTNKYIGMTARIFQHEMMHLDGKTFFDCSSRLNLEMACKKSNKQFKTNYSISSFC